MSDILKFFWNNLGKFSQFLFLYFAKSFSILIKNSKEIHPKDRIKDLMAVLSSTSMLLLLNFIALIIFIILPQGKDVIYIVSEDIISFKLGSLFWLLGGLICWSYISEFASRYAIYVTDNSGLGLTDERVKWRKELQNTLSSFFLILPYIIVLISILVNFLQDTAFSKWHGRIGFGVPALLVYLLLNITTKVYFSDINSNVGWFIKFLIKIKSIPPIERMRAESLYGMYNDFIFTVRKPDNFVGEPNDLLIGYINRMNDLGIKSGFPQNHDFIESNTIVSDEFKLKTFSTEPEKPSGRYRWVYYIPNNFYKSIHKQLLINVLISIILFLILTFLPVNGYQNIGTPGLLILSFSCWIGIYMGILYLDYGFFRPRYKFNNSPTIIYAEKLNNKIEISEQNCITNDEWTEPTKAGQILSRISIRFILFTLFILCSIFNNDHPVRYNSNGTGGNENRPPLLDHFNKWFSHYSNDSSFHLFYKDTLITKIIYECDTIQKEKKAVTVVTKDSIKCFPVVFICAEGGAMRTGAFTAMLLSYIQEHLDSFALFDFSKSIYAYSGVSGGSLGVSFFNAVTNLNNSTELLIKDSILKTTMNFFKGDFLAPVIGKMFYGDVLNLFLPFRYECFDRAISLEKAWENAYQTIINDRGRNYFSNNYLQIYASNHIFPAVFINTMEVETGRQCWLCNVKPDTSMFKSNERDLLNYKIRGGINYSTMINFSSRFPLFSPGACLIQNDVQKYHYVDGGYVENTGSATMVEILKALSPIIQDSNHYFIPKGFMIKPYVIQIRFSDGMSTFKNINFGNEVTEILEGIYNTRQGRTEAASNELSKIVKLLNGKFISINLDMDKNQVPMNWVLSDKCLDNVLVSIKKQFSSLSTCEDTFFPFDSTYFNRIRTNCTVRN